MVDALAAVQNVTLEEIQDDSSEGTVYSFDDDIALYPNTVLTEDLHVAASFHFLFELRQSLEDYFAISDGGADSTILGLTAGNIRHTGRYARLISYDPDNTKYGRVPIVSAFLKTKNERGDFILLFINEAPYLSHSAITLLSEFQIREYGKIIDSCATTHCLSTTPLLYGKQRFEVDPGVHVPFTNRGGIIGMQIFQYEEGDDQKYDVYEITSKAQWIPSKHRSISDNTSFDVSLPTADDERVHTHTRSTKLSHADFLLGQF